MYKYSGGGDSIVSSKPILMIWPAPTLIVVPEMVTFSSLQPHRLSLVVGLITIRKCNNDAYMR